MIKRPMSAFAAAAVLISVILVCFFNKYFFPASSLKDGDKVSFECRVLRIEEKSNSCHIYVRRGKYRLLVTAGKDAPLISSVRIGNTIQGTFTFVSWQKARNRGNFDEEKYYRSAGIYQKYKLAECTVMDHFTWLPGELARICSEKIQKQISGNCDSDTAGILSALVCGSRSLMDNETRDLFRVSGLAHLFAVSGLHISFVGRGLYKLLRKRASFAVSMPAAFLAVTLYSLMCGGSASSVRACIMLLVSIMAEGLGRKYDIISSFSLAAILLLISNPFYIMNSAFRLSFLAIMALSMATGTASCYIFGKKKELPSKAAERLVINILKALVASMTVTCATLPVILSEYFEYPLYAPIINIIVMAAVPYMLGGTLAAVAAGAIFPFAGSFLMGIPVYLTRAICTLCRIFSKLPGNVVCTGYRSKWMIIAYYALLAGILIIFHMKERPDKKSPGGPLKYLPRFALYAASCMVLVMFISVRGSNSFLKISFIDVDQGECILMISDTGHTYLTDAGSVSVGNVFNYRINTALKYQGVNVIDNMIVTHPDTDHISGIIEILSDENERVRIENLLIGNFEGNENYEKLINLAKEKNVNLIRIYEGMEISDGDLLITCLHPQKDAAVNDDVNANSAVLKIQYGDFSALVTGDISSKEEKELIDKGLIREQVTLLDVAHHGSGYSSCSEILDILSPETAIISAGVNNVYGHPHPDALRRISDTGSDIYCTSEFGEIDIEAYMSGRISIDTMLP